jgi:type II secretory pathway pseudopilin PulG
MLIADCGMKENRRILALEKGNRCSAFRIPCLSGRQARSEIGDKGFTLIEIIILIVMAGILLPTIIVPFVSAVKSSGKPEMATTAMYLAHQKMEEFMKYRYLDSVLNPTAITSYANISGFPDYQWQWERLYVDDNFNVVGDGIQTTNHRGYKRILVRVKDPMNDTYVIYSVVSFFH